MNLPEYRAALHAAHTQFRATVEDAAQRLQGALQKADAAFYEEQPKAVAAEQCGGDGGRSQKLARLREEYGSELR